MAMTKDKEGEVKWYGRGRGIAIDVAKVAVVPGEAFGAPGNFRLSYALGDADLLEGVSRLASLFSTATA